ncbi:MAG: hypothetical protein WB507_08710 [Solirubrobacterales bacterium]
MMRDAAAPGRQEPVAVPLRGLNGLDEEPQSAWAPEETVPLRVAAEQVEAEERADRLRLVTGRRRARRR